MRTFVVEVDELEAGAYPVRLLADDGRPDWLTAPVEQASIPGEISLPAHLGGGGTAPLRAVREAFLGARDGDAVLAQIGTYLGDLVIREDIRRTLEARAAQFAGEGPGQEGIRLLFRVQPVELRRLPWELIRWRHGPLAAFSDERNPCARLHRLDPPAAPPDRCWPVLRILVVVGALAAEVHTDEEIARIRRSLVRHTGFVDLEIRHRPQRAELVELCRERRPHILHFVGHGTGDALEFATDGDHPGWSWGTSELAVDLQGWVPRLVVLNACRSAQIDAQSETWDLIDALFQLGVPAIVGMQGDIDGAAAAAFGGALYQGLIRGCCVDAAVAVARNEMTRVVPADSRDVWLPTLTLSAPPERVLPQQYGVTPAECQTIVNVFRDRHECEIYAFVDREAPRRTLWRDVGVELDTQERGGALAIVGARSIGKSALAKWFVGALALRGANAAYVQLDREHTLGATELLGVVADELIDSDRHGAANDAALRAYFEQLERVRPGSETIHADLFQAFRAALEAAAGDQELVIALDNPGSVDASYWDTYVAPLLLKPIAERTIPVRLILVAERAVYERLVPSRLRARVPEIELDKLRPGDFVRLATQHVEACGYDVEGLGPILERMGEMMERRGHMWDGEGFKAIHQVARSGGDTPPRWTCVP